MNNEAQANLHQLCQNSITRMSNLGMTVKTTGLAFFGAGIAHFATSDLLKISLKQGIAYLVALTLLISAFAFTEIHYLQIERAFREIDQKVVEGKWKSEWPDLEIIRKNPKKYKSATFRKCVTSKTLLSFFMVEFLTILIFLYIVLTVPRS